MFCPHCGKQNQDNVVFCAYCGKTMSQKDSSPPAIRAIPGPKKASAPKVRISFTAIKAIVTGILIIGLIVAVLLIYYPGAFPWNW